MIAWEVGIGSILLIWTSVRFRALCRAAEDREGRRWLRRLRRLAAPKRPPCGDDGVYWYEKYNTRGQGPFERGLNFVIFAGLFLAVGLIVVVIAVPAFSEFRARLRRWPRRRGAARNESAGLAVVVHQAQAAEPSRRHAARSVQRHLAHGLGVRDDVVFDRAGGIRYRGNHVRTHARYAQRPAHNPFDSLGNPRKQGARRRSRAPVGRSISSWASGQSA